MKNIKILVLVILLLPFVMKSQDEEPSGRIFIVDMHVLINHFQGKLNDNLRQDINPGFELGGLVQWKEDSPFFLGLSVNYSLLSSYGNSFNEIIDGESVNVSTSANSSFLGFIPKVRVYLPYSYFKTSLFSEFGLNYKWIYNYSSFRISEFDESDGEFNEHSSSFGYIGAIGLNITFSDKYHMLLKAAYMSGTSTDYLAKIENPDEFSDSINSFELKNSTFNMFSYHLGISIFL